MRQPNVTPSTARFADVEPLSALPEDALKGLAEHCVWHQLPPNHPVIDGNSGAPHGVFLLIEGMIELSRRNSKDVAVPIGRLKAPACFGEFAAVMNAPGTTSAHTVIDSRLAEIPAMTFLALMNEHPAMALGLLRKAISIVRSLDDDIIKLHMADEHLAMMYRKAILRGL